MENSPGNTNVPKESRHQRTHTNNWHWLNKHPVEFSKNKHTPQNLTRIRARILGLVFRFRVRRFRAGHFYYVTRSVSALSTRCFPVRHVLGRVSRSASAQQSPARTCRFTGFGQAGRRGSRRMLARCPAGSQTLTPSVSPHQIDPLSGSFRRSLPPWQRESYAPAELIVKSAGCVPRHIVESGSGDQLDAGERALAPPQHQEPPVQQGIRGARWPPHRTPARC